MRSKAWAVRMGLVYLADLGVRGGGYGMAGSVALCLAVDGSVGRLSRFKD